MSFHDIDPGVRKLLMINDDILLTAKQAKGVPGGSICTPNSIYVTNTRVIFKNPKLFGLKADIIDVNYRDISNVRLKRGMFSTEIYLNTRNRAEEISLPAVDKQIAQDVINLIQKGIHGELPNQNRNERILQRPIPQSAEAQAIETSENHYAKLGKLADLKQKGALSKEEFQLLKNNILKKISSTDGVVARSSYPINEIDQSSTRNDDFKHVPILNVTPVIHLLHYFAKIVGLDYDSIN